MHCTNLACWWLVDGPGHDDYTLACDDHVGALRSATTTAAYVIPEEYPCCYIAPRETAEAETKIRLVDAPLQYPDPLVW